MQTVDMKMNWTAAASLIAITLENSTTQTGRNAARAELANMAKAADLWNAHAAALVELVRATRDAERFIVCLHTGEGARLARMNAALAAFAELVPAVQS